MTGKTRKFYKRGWSHTKRRGHETNVNCGFCGRIVPKFRTFPVTKGFTIKDPALRRDLGGDIPFITSKIYACPSCARHRSIVQKNRNRG